MMKACVFYILFLLTIAGITYAQNPLPSSHLDEKTRVFIETQPSEASAITNLIKENGGKLPNTLTQLRHYLDNSYRAFGEVRTSTIPFSDAPGYTDLEEARNLYLSPLNDLYIGAIPRLDGSVDLEFISRNDETNQFDFGIIKNFGKKNAEMVIVDRNKCTVCHKAGGPIYPIEDWKNTINEAGRNLESFKLVYRAFIKKLGEKDSDFYTLHIKTEELLKQPVPFGGFPIGFANSRATIEAAPYFKMWHGALISPAPAFVMEERVRDANQVLVFRNWLEKGTTPDVKNNALRYYLGQAFGVDLGSTYVHEKYKDEFEKFPGNLPVIVKEHSLNHIELKEVKTVDDVIQLSNKKRAQAIKNTSAEESPLNENRFLQTSRPLLGEATGKMNGDSLMMAYSNSLGIVRRGELVQKGGEYISLIYRSVPGLLNEEEFASFSKSDTFMNFIQRNHLPNRTELKAAIFAWKNKSEFSINRRSNIIVPEPARKKACVECHFGDNAILPISFDPASLETWKSMLTSKDPKTVASAKIWLQPVLSHLKAATMPPKPFENHLTQNERKALIEYLDSVK